MSIPQPSPDGSQAAWKHPKIEDASKILPAPPPPQPQPSKPAMIADLNVDPPESDGEDCTLISHPDSTTRGNNDESSLVKSTVIARDADVIEGEDLDQQCPVVSMSREEKVGSLKAGLVHVARKMPKNAHAHFILGLMYQRLGQPQKAVSAFEKSSEILSRDEEEIRRPDLLSLVLTHQAQCILQANSGDNSDKELETEELEEILAKMKDSVLSDVKQAAVWNSLGLILMRTNRLQSAISILSSLLVFVPEYLDSLANLGVAYLQSGNLELSGKCFQDLILKDHNHPAAFVNYAVFLLCYYGSVVTGAGAGAGEGADPHQVEATAVAKECLLAAIKSDPKSGPLWVNLASAYDVAGDHRNAKKCLEQVAKLEPGQMSVRYAIAVHRIKDAERYQDSTEQLSWAANEMCSILKEGDPAIIDLTTAWTGLAMAHRAQQEISAAYETGSKDLAETEERALYMLKQAIDEDPDDPVQWHQLGLHYLYRLQFKTSVRFLKAALARRKECAYAWSNLGISLQLSGDPSSAEEAYKRAISLSSTPQHVHATLSNLGNLYRQQRRYEHAKAILTKSLELSSGYAPAHNNLGLVFVAEGQLDEAIASFEKALQLDPLLDAAKSNMAKAIAMSKKPETT
ncbi:putative protein O-GlcNAc transferase [Dioscorea sansibarensis]